MNLHTAMAALVRRAGGGDRRTPVDRASARRRAGAVQRHPRRDPHRPSRPVPRRAGREQQPRALAGRQHPHAPGIRGPGGLRRDRRGHDRDGPPRRLRAARGEPIREVGGDVLHARVPRERLPPARVLCSSRSKARCPNRRSTPGSSRRSACSPTTSSPASGPPRTRAAAAFAERVPRGDDLDARARQAGGGRPLPHARVDAPRRPPRPPPCGAWPSSARSGIPTRSGAPASRTPTSCSTPSTPTAPAWSSRSTTTTRPGPASCTATAGCTWPSTPCSSELRSLPAEDPRLVDAEWPFVLAAGERRAFTANTIFRDPDWRKKDREGSLRIHPDDAATLGLVDGSRARVITKAGSTVAVVEHFDAMTARFRLAAQRARPRLPRRRRRLGGHRRRPERADVVR